jgi:lipopolysaccharide export system protein LptA
VIRRSIATGLLVPGLLLALLMAAATAWGQPAAPPPPASSPAAPAKAPAAPKQEFPLHISAAQMEANQEQHVIIFTGQVKADYGDSTLYTDKLLVFYKSKEEKPKVKGKTPAPPAANNPATSPLAGLGGDQLERLEAWGNVRYVQGDRVATGEKAIYYRDKDEIVLLGHPQVWRGEDYMKGSKIIMHLATRKVEVESTPNQRVEAHLYPATLEGKTPPALFPPGGKRTVPRTGRSK